jgi:hypothetical protein
MKKFTFIAIAALLIGAGSAHAAGLAVNGAAALQGSYGLEIVMDGTNAKAYVEDQTPADESIYRISFLINMNDLVMAGPTAVTNQHAIIDTTTTGGDIGLRLVLQDKKKLSRWQIKAKAGVSISTNPTKTTRKTSPVELEPTGAAPTTHQIDIEWQEGSAPDVRDGFIRIRVDGGAWSSNTLENFDFGIDKTKFGGINGVDTTSTGSFYLDDFQSFRSLAP